MKPSACDEFLTDNLQLYLDILHLDGKSRERNILEELLKRTFEAGYIAGWDGGKEVGMDSMRKLLEVLK